MDAAFHHARYPQLATISLVKTLAATHRRTKKLDVDYTGCTEKNVGDALRKLIAVNQVRKAARV